MSHDSIADLYKNSDVFVLPSLNEGMSNALLEAMASGLPIIVTDTGGTAELVHGNGVIVPMGDSDAILEAISGLIYNPEERQQMSFNSRRIAEGMAWGAVGNEYIKAYEKVLSGEKLPCQIMIIQQI